MLVMNGKRNLTEESIGKFCGGMSLHHEESEFFRNLVFFNQAKTHHEKNAYYQKLLQSKKFKKLKPIEKQHYEYYSTWYHPVVRELVAAHDFDGSSEWISARTNPSLTPMQVTKSIELLQSLGLIYKNSKNRWEQTNPIVSTGPELKSLIVHNYHKSILDLTLQVMDTLSVKEREVSTMTLGVKKDRIPELKAKIREFRQEILKMVSVDTEPEEVAQLNIQFFPLTKILENPKS